MAYAEVKFQGHRVIKAEGRRLGSCVELYRSSFAAAGSAFDKADIHRGCRKLETWQVLILDRSRYATAPS